MTVIAAAHLAATDEPTYVYRRASEGEGDGREIVRLGEHSDGDGDVWQEVPWLAVRRLATVSPTWREPSPLQVLQAA